MLDYHRALDGTTVEAATVGDEGMLGIEAFLSADAVAPGEAFMQVPDTNAEMLSVERVQARTPNTRRPARLDGALHPSRHRADDAIHGVQRPPSACSNAALAGS